MRAAVAFVVLAALCGLVHGVAPGTNWAVLVAGSNTYSNYRHQADVCHSYQVLHKHGIPDSNIIVMMDDDIAHNPSNPVKGNIINQPNGPNVYTNVPKDYTGENVNPQNFLKVLRGDKEGMRGVGSGRVLESGPNDNVFIFFSDHGGPRIIAFPDDVLQAEDLNSALNYMYVNKKFNQLVFYLEACESGSMFDGLLPPNTNIYATTASDPDSSSYACYYDTKRQTYLGDVYSVNWLQDSDKANFNVETLAQQYQIVKQETNTSTVEQYGQLNIATQQLKYFQQGPATRRAVPAVKHIAAPHPTLDAVNSRHVPLEILRRRIANAESEEERQQASEELQILREQHSQIDKIYSKIVSRVTNSTSYQVLMQHKERATRPMFACVDAANRAFHDKCVNLGQYEYALQGLNALVGLCRHHKMEEVVGAIKTVCNNGLFVGGVY